MKILFAIALSIVAILLSGCGKEAGKTTANVTILSGLAAVVPGQTGGTMLLGANPQTGQNFSKVFDGAPIELPNGFWDFAVVSWDGNGTDQVMQGITRCGIVRGFALTGGEQGVSLSISSTNCNDPFFGFDDTKNSVTGEPLPLQPSTCTDPEAIRNSFDGVCENSTTSAYRVVFPEKRLDGSVGPGLASICVSEDTPTTPELDSATHAIRIPIFPPRPNSPPLVIDLHDQTDCSDPPDRRIINNIYTGEINIGETDLVSEGDPNLNEVLLSKNPCTSPVGQNPTTPFSPDAGTSFALCNADQFVNHIPGNLAGTYKLYSDLDFSGQGVFSDPVVNNDFTGRLDGRGHTIRNVSFNQTTTNATGLFRQIDGDGTLTGQDSNIQDLVLESFDIVTSGNSNGALAGNVFWGTTISRVTIRNINMTVNAAVSNHGGLVGNFTALAGGTAGTFTRVYAIKAENITITTAVNATNVGGIAGQFNSSNELADVVVNGVSINPTGGAPSPLGGVIGAATSGRLFSVTAKSVNLGNTTNNLPGAASQVGGLTGICQGCEIRDSKAVVNIYGGGNEIGGLIGAAYDVQLSNNVSMVNIPVAPTGTGVGGHIGNISPISNPNLIELSRSFGSINCSALSCGGFAGVIQNGTVSGTVDLNDNFSEVDVNSTASNVGGFLGLVNATNSGTINVIGNSAFPPTEVKGSTNIGGFVGRVAGTPSSVSDNIFKGSLNVVTGTGGGFVGVNDAATVDRNISYLLSITGTANSFAGSGINTPTFTNNFNITGAVDGNSTTLTTGEAATQASFTGFDFTPATGFWVMGTSYPEIRGVKAISDIGGTFTGSNTDPIILTSAAQWNSIGDKPSLMSKVYRLGNTLDFGMGTFVPIGSVANPFVGKLQGNNQTIQNINFVDSEANAPVGLFRKIGVDAYNGPTEIEHENPFNYDNKFSLIIRNVSISKAASQIGAAGILAGVVQDDGGTSPWSGQNHDYNMSVKIGGIEIYDSYVDGGKQTTGSQVGGLVGNFLHTNGQTELRDIRISNTEVYSGVQNGGTGGVIGRHFGPLNATATPSLRQFDGFILDGLTVQASGTNADYVGGVVGALGAATAFWEFIVVSNTNVSGYARVGGMFGDVGFGNTINQGSFVGGSVTGQTLVGGIAGNVGNSTVKGMLSKASVSSVATGAGCIAGQGSGGTNIIVENSVGICPSVTSGGTASYFVAIGLNTTNPTVNNVYTGPADEGLGAKFIYLTADQMLDPIATAPVITSGDPWILDPGFEPVPFWFIFPEALER